MSDLLQELDDATSDKELYDAASAIIAIPKARSEEFWVNSFTLHAPLEISARYFLLPLVDDDHVQAARARIRLAAKKYHGLEDETETESVAPLNLDDIDVNRWASSLLFASHAPILLAMQYLLDETNDSIHAVLSRMSAFINVDSAAQMSWTKDKVAPKELSADDIAHPQQWFIDNVGNVAHVANMADGIREEVEAVEKAGVVEPIVSALSSIGAFSDRADFIVPFQALMRVAVVSMVTEDDEHAKYGWTHCTTIPHSLFVLNDKGDSTHLIKAAATYVATFRSLFAKNPVTLENVNEYFEQDEDSIFAEHYVRITDIISRACTLEDAHLVKYVYTCFDLMKRDPHYSRLYIDAAQKLLDIWKSEETTQGLNG